MRSARQVDPRARLASFIDDSESIGVSFAGASCRRAIAGSPGDSLARSCRQPDPQRASRYVAALTRELDRRATCRFAGGAGDAGTEPLEIAAGRCETPHSRAPRATALSALS